MFAREIGLGGSVVSEIVSASIKRGIFDKDKYEKYQILTSKGIQQRYFGAVSRRKLVEVESEYLLLDATQIPKNVDIKRVSADISLENVDISKQRKGKESKGKDKGIGAEPQASPAPEPIPAAQSDPLDEFDGRLRQSIFDWLAYKQEKRQAYKPTGLKSLLTQIRGHADKYGDAAVCEVITASMASNYQGIVFDRLKSTPTHARQAGGNIFADMLREEGVL